MLKHIFMHLILTLIALGGFFICINSDIYANESDIIVITSENIPGANCECSDTTDLTCSKVETRKYTCTVKPGLAGFQTILAQVIRYIINIVLLLGVLAVVGLGITWSFAGGDDVKMKSTLKTWAINIVVGLIILFLFKYILMFIAPWIYQ